MPKNQPRAKVLPVMNTSITLSPVDMQTRKNLDIHSGDTVRVWSKIQEKGKTRLQAFEGVVLARKHGTEMGGTITVRKVSNSVGVERVFPLYSPMIDKIEITKKTKTRRSKLYFIRDKAVKEIRKKMKAVFRNALKVDEEFAEDEETEKVETETPEMNEESTPETVESTESEAVESSDTAETSEESEEETKPE